MLWTQGRTRSKK